MSEEKNQTMYDFAIVGGGIVGAATAFKLQSKFPDHAILLIEKEDVLAEHQTGNNSGVIHSGLYYKPGSAKAETCVDGRKQLVSFAKEYNIDHDVCGKVVVATDSTELPFLDKIYQNGIENNTEGIEKITGSIVKEIEPHVEGIAGIWVPCTGIIDFRAATNKMVELAMSKQQRSILKTGEEVLSFKDNGSYYTIETSKSDFLAKRMIFCSGLQADRMAMKDSISLDMRIVGFRGDYYELTGKREIES